MFPVWNFSFTYRFVWQRDCITARHRVADRSVSCIQGGRCRFPLIGPLIPWHFNRLFGGVFDWPVTTGSPWTVQNRPLLLLSLRTVSHYRSWTCRAYRRASRFVIRYFFIHLSAQSLCQTRSRCLWNARAPTLNPAGKYSDPYSRTSYDIS